MDDGFLKGLYYTKEEAITECVIWRRIDILCRLYQMRGNKYYKIF